jgi:hypothetical protein
VSHWLPVQQDQVSSRDLPDLSVHVDLPQAMHSAQ